MFLFSADLSLYIQGPLPRRANGGDRFGNRVAAAWGGAPLRDACVFTIIVW